MTTTTRPRRRAFGDVPRRRRRRRADRRGAGGLACIRSALGFFDEFEPVEGVAERPRRPTRSRRSSRRCDEPPTRPTARPRRAIEVGGETIDRLTAFSPPGHRRRPGGATRHLRGDGADVASRRRRRPIGEPISPARGRVRGAVGARRLGHRRERRRPRDRAGGARADAATGSSPPAGRSSLPPPASGPVGGSSRGTTATSRARRNVGCGPRSRSTDSVRSTTPTCGRSARIRTRSRIGYDIVPRPGRPLIPVAFTTAVGPDRGCSRPIARAVSATWPS